MVLYLSDMKRLQGRLMDDIGGYVICCEIIHIYKREKAPIQLSISAIYSFINPDLRKHCYQL